MWRVAIVVWLAACSDPAMVQHTQFDAAIDAPVVHETAPFTIQLCTSGSPGDATCPINRVNLDALGPAAAGARLVFVTQTLADDTYFTMFHIEGVSRLHIDDLIVAKTDGSNGLFVESLDTGVTADSLVLTESAPTGQVVIRVARVY